MTKLTFLKLQNKGMYVQKEKLQEIKTSYLLAEEQ